MDIALKEFGAILSGACLLRVEEINKSFWRRKFERHFLHYGMYEAILAVSPPLLAWEMMGTFGLGKLWE